MHHPRRARSAGLIVLTLLLALWAVFPAFAAPGGNGNGRGDGELPPGLADRDALPPGLSEKGIDLPPGLLEGTTTITFLHHNDGESQLLAGDDGIGGVAEFATLVDELRASAPTGDGDHGVFLVSAGDNFLAGPELNASFDADFDPFYDVVALDQIGYDALVIGNHEFDFGPDVLEEFIRAFSSPPPVLSANLDFSGEPGFSDLADGDGPIASSTVFTTTEGTEVGLIGATTENLPFVSSPRNVAVGAVAPAVQAEIDALTDAGVEIIVLAAHLQGLDTDEALLAQLSGVDVAIAGGGDELLANPGDVLAPGDEAEGPYPTLFADADGNGVPIVTGPGDFAYLGQFSVVFDADGEAIAWEGGPVLNQGFAPDPTIQALVQEPVAEYLEDLATTVIGTSEVDLEGRRPFIRVEETNEGNLMADSLLWQATQSAPNFGLDAPDVAIQNGGGIRNNSVIPAGDITLLDTFDIAPFSNFVTVFPDLPRETVDAVLENAVSNVENVDGRWAHVAGMSFTYDPTGAPGERIVDVTLDDGTEIVVDGTVVAGDPISLVTIDFLARGGDQYPFGDAEFVVLGSSYQQALANYIIDGLGGLISQADYPEGGEGRIEVVNGLPSPT